MKPTSAIQKGKRFENWVAHQSELIVGGEARREVGSGSGKRKGDIAWPIEFTPECKNETGVPQWLMERIEQAERQALGAQPWVLIIRDPRKGEGNMRAFAVCDLGEWFELVKKAKEPKTFRTENKNLQYKLRRLSQDAKEVLREIEE